MIANITQEHVTLINKILKIASSDLKTYGDYERSVEYEIRKDFDMMEVVDGLINDGILQRDSNASETATRLTDLGKDIKRRDNGYVEFLKKKEEKRIKDERDDRYKTLQVQELVMKLNTINPEQLDFWKSQKIKNNQTTIIAIIGIIISLIALLKSFGWL